MKKLSKFLMTVIILSSLLISCGNKATPKIKKENLLKVEKRDLKIGKGTPKISFDKESFNFGTVKEGAVVKTTFVLTNTGKSDLVITDAKSSCGCTIPIWPKDPIKPGEKSEVKVKFNTSGKTNRQSKSVTLYTNTVKGAEVVKLTGFVTPKK